MTEHDNNNRGSLWKAKGFAGKLNIGGVDYYVLMAETLSRNESAPKYQAIISKASERNSAVVPVFKVKKEGSKAVASFKYAEHVVFVYINDSTTPNAPTLRLSALPDAPQQAAPAPAQASNFDGEECPF